MFNKIFTTYEMISLITFNNKYIFKSYEGFKAIIKNKRIVFLDKTGHEIKDLNKIEGLAWEIEVKTC